MSTEIPWRKTLGFKLTGIALAFLGLSVLFISGTFYMLASLRADASWLAHSSEGRLASHQVLNLAHRLFEDSAGQTAAATKRELRGLLEDAEQRLARLRNGDSGLGFGPATDPEVIDNLRAREELWHNQVRPAVEALLQKPVAAKADLTALDASVGQVTDLVNNGTRLEQAASQRKTEQFRILLYVFAGLVVVIFSLVLWLSRSIVHRTRALAGTARRIADGELTLRAGVGGGDELAALAESFNTMTGNLRTTIETEKGARGRVEKLLESVREAVAQLTSASAEILSSTTEQAAGAQEQAAAVSQTVATVDEVLQTSEQAAQRAKGVGDAVQRTMETGKAGRKAVEDSVAALGAVRERVEATATDIVTLAEKAQSIGEIIATVNDIAEKTNLLALNAAIEASRAGEHGRGFTVVAGEVKVLAEQSKKATGQVRQILGEIQKGTNKAVLSTEEVTKGVTAATRVSLEAGEAIKVLGESLADGARAGAQIVASAGQQATGMAQIHQAMKNIDQVAKQNLSAMRQAEQAAQNLNVLGTQLAKLSAE